MTIHSEHPFLPPDAERDPLRRLRGRVPAPVTIWAAGEGSGRRGLTVSSMLIADGEPGMIAGLIDEDSDLADVLDSVLTVNLLALADAHLADAFGGVAPAPGGPFTLGSWQQTEWGPVLDSAAGWVGARIVPGEPRHLGWGLLVEAVIEHIELADSQAMAHIRGRYRDCT